MTLSVIIATHADNAELALTLNSLLLTTPDVSELEVIVVDDASPVPVGTLGAALMGGHVRVHRNSRRIGVGASRHVGALMATGQFLLIIDSHMRFTPGWYQAAMLHASTHLMTLCCGVCLALDDTHKDVNHPDGAYYGATWNMAGHDRNRPSLRQVFETVWALELPGEDYEISAVMGACYFIARDFYLRLNPLQFFRGWGGDEASLSLKCWLAGGDMRLLKNVRIGHKFRSIKRVPFPVRSDEVLYNKLFTLHTCLPQDVVDRFLKKFQRGGHFQSALRMLYDD